MIETLKQNTIQPLGLEHTIPLCKFFTKHECRSAEIMLIVQVGHCDPFAAEIGYNMLTLGAQKVADSMIEFSDDMCDSKRMFIQGDMPEYAINELGIFGDKTAEISIIKIDGKHDIAFSFTYDSKDGWMRTGLVFRKWSDDGSHSKIHVWEQPASFEKSINSLGMSLRKRLSQIEKEFKKE